MELVIVLLSAIVGLCRVRLILLSSAYSCLTVTYLLFPSMTGYTRSCMSSTFPFLSLVLVAVRGSITRLHVRDSCFVLVRGMTDT